MLECDWLTAITIRRMMLPWSNYSKASLWRSPSNTLSTSQKLPLCLPALASTSQVMSHFWWSKDHLDALIITDVGNLTSCFSNFDRYKLDNLGYVRYYLVSWSSIDCLWQMLTCLHRLPKLAMRTKMQLSKTIFISFPINMHSDKAATAHVFCLNRSQYSSITYMASR